MMINLIERLKYSKEKMIYNYFSLRLRLSDTCMSSHWAQTLLSIGEALLPILMICISFFISFKIVFNYSLFLNIDVALKIILSLFVFSLVVVPIGFCLTSLFLLLIVRPFQATHLDYEEEEKIKQQQQDRAYLIEKQSISCQLIQPLSRHKKIHKI